MDGREFLKVAESLPALKREAYVRTSIGQFFAAYLETRSFCEAHLGLVRTARSSEHQEVPTPIARIDPDIANERK